MILFNVKSYDCGYLQFILYNVIYSYRNIVSTKFDTTIYFKMLDSTMNGHISKDSNCTARQSSPLRRKFTECYIIKPAQSLLMKHLVIGQR